jgi:hypothetical protein
MFPARAAGAIGIDDVLARRCLLGSKPHGIFHRWFWNCWRLRHVVLIRSFGEAPKLVLRRSALCLPICLRFNSVPDVEVRYGDRPLPNALEPVCVLLSHHHGPVRPVALLHHVCSSLGVALLDVLLLLVGAKPCFMTFLSTFEARTLGAFQSGFAAIWRPVVF